MPGSNKKTSAAVSPILVLLVSDSMKFCIPFRGGNHHPKHHSQKIIQLLPYYHTRHNVITVKLIKKKEEEEDINTVMFLPWALETHFSPF